MDKSKIVDLTQTIIADQEHFPCKISLDDITDIMPNVKHHPDDWYILSGVEWCTHCGTHVEMPFHHVKGGKDLSEIDFRTMIGPLCVIDVTKFKDKEEIPLDYLKKYDKKIKKGSIVFFWTGSDKLFHTPKWDTLKPYLSIEGGKWLINEKEIGCIGCDSPDIEVPGLMTQPIHQIVFAREVPMVESCANLDKVHDGDWICMLLPYPIKGCDSIPSRIIAIPASEMNATF
ncbi:MAG: cyclase family protein [Planctomycetaceae bacterium]|nr:cyclase family protein [Planctomycetaceae bacterium]